MTMDGAIKTGRTVDLPDTSTAPAHNSPKSPGHVKVSCTSAVPDTVDSSDRAHQQSMHGIMYSLCCSAYTMLQWFVLMRGLSLVLHVKRLIGKHAHCQIM